MHEQEIKVLWRGGLLLAATSLFRLAVGPATSAALPAGPSVLDSLTVESAAAALEEERRARPLEPGELIDPNQADAADLARLPGIGPALAQRIVDHRTETGAFTTLPDLAKVRGIGPRSLERMAGSLKLAPAPREPLRRSTAGRGAGDSGRRPTQAAQRDVLDALNQATGSELEQLPGVGPALAERILEFRANVGRLRSPAQLLEVPGIGPGRMAAIERALPAWAASVAASGSEVQ